MQSMQIKFTRGTSSAAVLGVVAVCGIMLLAHTVAFGQGVQQGVEDLGNKLVQNLPKDKSMVVVVSDFTTLQGETCELGRYISARLTTKLSQTPNIQVRERSRLNQVLAELAFGMEGLVDPAKAKQIGKLFGADALKLGEISDFQIRTQIDRKHRKPVLNHAVCA